MTTNFKTKTPRDPAYLKWLRTQPCCLCGSRQHMNAHHTETGGMGIKGKDTTAIPLCATCHINIHSHFRKDVIPNLEKIIANLREKYLHKT